MKNDLVIALREVQVASEMAVAVAIYCDEVAPLSG
jgi:hypothetical protein